MQQTGVDITNKIGIFKYRIDSDKLDGCGHAEAPGNVWSRVMYGAGSKVVPRYLVHLHFTTLVININLSFYDKNLYINLISTCLYKIHLPI